MIQAIQKTIDLGDGREIIIETGKLAKQAHGSVVLKIGNTMLLAAVTSADDAKEDVDFMPLQVEYKEKYAALGRIPGGFVKREGRPSDYEILISRLVDRALRPLFPEDYHAETFVTINLISADGDTLPDAYAGLAASAALAVSDIPFNGPISEVRVSRINGKLVINPGIEAMKSADIDIIVAATMDNILMVEGEMNEISEAEMLEAIKVAHDEIKKHCKAQIELTELVKKTVKRTYNHETNDEDLKASLTQFCYSKIYEAAKKFQSKHERNDAFKNVKNEFINTLTAEDQVEKASLISRYFHTVEKDAIRRLMLDEGCRLDGRKMDEIRPIWSEIGYLPSAHGSAIFTRGETQSLTSVTLGTKLDEKMIDEVLFKGTEKFVLHYNFPPFSTGDAKASRGIGRREIGHGNLAHRALKKVMPSDFPYAVRVVSDILESNGSSSMATVCAGTLALMDAGVPIKKPVTGIAMGLITDTKTDKFVVLSDILGDEDHLGDMDFKVTGTRDGITATQMDIKVDGLSYDVLKQALEQARRGRLHILDKILETIAVPNEDLKPHAPRIERLIFPKEFMGAVIGPGGKIVQEIQATTSTTITLEEVGATCVCDIFSTNGDNLKKALTRIKGIVTVPEVGDVYTATIKSIMPYGAFVEFLPGKEGLLHISEIEWRRIDSMEGILKENEKVDVKLIGVDPKTGKFKLSRKVLLPKPEKEEKE